MAKKPTTDAGADNAGTAIAELSPEQRAEQALKFETTREQLKALAQQSTSLVNVETEDNLAAAKAAHAKLRSTRVAIEKTGKAARDDANKFGKAVIAKERDLIGLISPEEERLSGLITAEQLRREAAEQAAREAEQRRAEQIRAAFARVRSLPDLAANLDLAGIDELIAEATKLRDDPSHLPEDLQAAGRYEANVAINGCKAARDRRVQADKDAAELEEFRRQKAEQERQQQRAQANAAEVQRAAGVVAANAQRAAEDDDLPPGHEGQRQRAMPSAVAAQIPDSVQVPVRKVLPLLNAARAALALLRERGLGGEAAALDLADAIDEANASGGA